MRALDDEVRRGRVLYVGVSNVPAWRIARANTSAELMGWSRFVGLQIEYSLIERAAERELIPMAIEMGLGVTPWSPLGGGVLTGKYRGPQEQPRRYRPDEGWGAQKLREQNLRIADEVVAAAGEAKCSPARLALRWVLDQPGVVSPIVGARTAAQLEDNLASLDLTIQPAHRERLDAASRIDLGYPHTFLADPSLRDNLTGGTRVAAP
jgi:aryl-alcohol dehydrogenase-like predicted oxidoreductase